MPVKILCPNPDCGASYSVVDETLGRLGRCKKCGTKFRLVPGTRGEGPPPSETGLGAAPMPVELDLPSPFGHHEILRTLGRGGMGAVYLALDSRLERRVALKVPHREFARDHGIRERFLREARAAARFHHPNFCPIYEIGEIDGLPYLTMAYIEGGTLASQLERGKPWDERRAAEVVRTLALALAEAHRQGIVHRDLKPANIMIDARGGLVIMDFGLARRFEADDPTLTASGAVLGTPGYMPPEQAEGHSAKVGPRSDVYSLGVILYELISGRRPFEGSVVRVLAMILTAPPPTPSTHHPEVHPDLESICLKAMAKEIEDRYPSMDDFAGALDDFLKAPPAPAPDEDSPGWAGLDLTSERSRQGKPCPARSPGRSWLVAVAVALMALGIIIYVSTDRGRIKIEGNDPNAEKVVVRTAPPATVPEKAVAGNKNPAIVPPKPDDPPITNSIGMKLAPIPAGDFQMGAPDGEPEAQEDEKPRHRVRITRPFYLGMYEVTQAEYREVMGSNPSWFSAEDGGKAKVAGLDTSRHPVERVSWLDAVAFCNKLSGREGLRPCYQPDGKRIEGGAGYRLPTEAEWEYACRAGTTTAFAPGEALSSTTMANFDGNYVYNGSRKGAYLRRTTRAGSYEPNRFGVYDMHGNVCEWCEGGYNKNIYKYEYLIDPIGPSGAAYRVIRGGGWSHDPRHCRSAYRGRSAPDRRDENLGFRVARVRPGP